VPFRRHKVTIKGTAFIVRSIKFGYQFDFRNPPGSDRSFVEVYREMFRQAERAEELGFDSLWLTEACA
jgi:hypothetical protein